MAVFARQPGALHPAGLYRFSCIHMSSVFANHIVRCSVNTRCM